MYISVCMCVYMWICIYIYIYIIMASIYRVHLIVLNITNKISNRALIYNGKEPINLIWYSGFI